MRKGWMQFAAGCMAAGMLLPSCLQIPAHAETANQATDVQLLEQWLLGQGVTLSDWTRYDLNGDGKLNAVDLTLLKRSLLTEHENEETVTAYIQLNGDSITFEGKNVAVSGTTVTISASGSYEIRGELRNGQICVNVPDEAADPGTVKLFLNGVTITNSSAPCILIENAENTSVNLEEGTTSVLSDGTTEPTAEAAEYAVLHAKDDLTVKGSGALEIYAGTQYGIHCNNDLKFNGGTVSVTTQNEDAVRGKTSVTVKSGTLHIDSEGDGIKSTKGSLTMTGGTIFVKSGKDALQAETVLSLTGGDISACGDRGLTAGSITLDGCNLLATATDNPCETLGTTAQNTMVLSMTKEWAKNNPISLTDTAGTLVYEKNTLKKFRYVIVSSPELKANTSYRLYVGGISAEQNGQNTFRAANPSVYEDVNNTETAELLYASLFDQSRVHQIELDLPESEWQSLLSNADAQEYHEANVTIDGELYEHVGVRTKGYSSLMFVTQANHDKYSLRIQFDKYDKYQNYHGLTEICLNNLYSDPSGMRDILCYNAMHEIGGYAPHTSYSDLYVNGSLYSFYFTVEQPGKTLAERYATDDDACLYKAEGYNCTLEQSQSLSDFELKFGDDDNLTHLSELIAAINTFGSDRDRAKLEAIVDVPSFLKGFAVNAVLCNYDSYNGSMAHNYYLMYNQGRFYYVGWDYNLCLGNFMDYGASVNSDITTGLYDTNAANRPMLTNLIKDDSYRALYYGYVNDILKYYENPEQTVNQLAELIRPHIQADPRYFFTPEQFESNIARSESGLTVGSGNGGMWGGFGGMWGGFGGGGGTLFSYGGDQVSITDFLIRRIEVIQAALRS